VALGLSIQVRIPELPRVWGTDSQGRLAWVGIDKNVRWVTLLSRCRAPGRGHWWSEAADDKGLQGDDQGEGHDRDGGRANILNMAPLLALA
jgi:hypothetical protein